MNEYFRLLPPEMLEAIEALQILHATPDSMAIQAVLGTANLAAMKMFNVDSRVYGIRPITEFFLCMAPTGAQKSTVYRECVESIQRFQDYKQEELRDEQLRFSMEKKAFAKAEAEYLKQVAIDPKSAQLPQAVRPVETARYIVNKGTVNGIVDQLKSQSFLGLFSSEAGEFFNAHSFQGTTQAKAIEMTASLTSMWDAHAIEKLTGMEQTTLRNRRVNMLFLLQSETIQQVMNTPVFSDQGFIHRILITQTGYYDKPDWQFDDEAFERSRAARYRLEAFHNRIASMMHQPESRRASGWFELDLPVMQQTDQAFEHLAQWRNANKNRGQQDLKNYAGFAERLHEHALRLAATVAAFQGQDIIKQRDAECATQLMEYYCQQRILLEVGIRDTNQDRTQGARRLAEWLCERAWTGSLNSLLQYGPYWYRRINKAQRNQIIEDLLSDEIIEMEQQLAENHRKVMLIRVKNSTDIAQA